eukprot:Skav221815  [mRNA]  locus=scaffold2435:201246:226737:- [translate_table: standard]
MVEFVHPLIQQLDESYGTFAECPHCTRATSSVMRANLLLFKTVIAGDSWGEIAVPVIEQFPLTAIVFMGSLLTLVFGVLNLIVVVDTFAEARQRDVIHLAEDLEVDLANDQVRLQRMFERIDEDGSGLVSYEELLAGARKDPEFQSRLRVMDIDEADLRQLFDMIDSTGEGEIESSEFIAALSRWVHDSKTAPRFVKYNMLRSLEMQEELQFVVQEQFDILSSRLEHSFIALERTMMENSHFGRISASQTLEQFRQCVGASPQPQEDEETKPPSSPQDAELPEQPHASLIPGTGAEALNSTTLHPLGADQLGEMGCVAPGWGLPLLMLATMFLQLGSTLFLSSNSGIGAVVMIYIKANGRLVAEIPPVFGFSLIGSIKDMYDGNLATQALRRDDSEPNIGSDFVEARCPAGQVALHAEDASKADVQAFFFKFMKKEDPWMQRCENIAMLQASSHGLGPSSEATADFQQLQQKLQQKLQQTSSIDSIASSKVLMLQYLLRWLQSSSPARSLSKEGAFKAEACASGAAW